MNEALNDAGRPRLRLTGSSALALSTVFTNLLRIVSTMCLTRLLSPDVYGITGMIMSVFYMVNMVTDIGLQAYVVRHQRSDEPDFLSAVFTIHAVRGVILAIIAALLAWPLSQLLAKPEIAAPLAVASIVFVIDGQVSLHQFRALRDGRVQRVTVIDIVMTFCQITSAIILAFFLRNVWAIVLSMIIASLARLWAGYALFPGSRHRFRRDREIAADLWQFSRVIAVSSTLTLVLTQVDKLAMARILSLGEFGTYVIASSLAGAPQVFAFNYSSSIVYPAAAAAWRENRSIADAYYGCWGRFFYLYAFGGGALIERGISQGPQVALSVVLLRRGPARGTLSLDSRRQHRADHGKSVDGSGAGRDRQTARHDRVQHHPAGLAGWRRLACTCHRQCHGSGADHRADRASGLRLQHLQNGASARGPMAAGSFIRSHTRRGSRRRRAGKLRG